MRGSGSIPVGVALSALAALVLATPTLFLPADVHVWVKLVFITVGSVLLAIAAVRVRAEGTASAPEAAADEDPLTRD